MKTRNLCAAFCLAASTVLMSVAADAALLGLSPAEPTIDFGANGVVHFKRALVGTGGVVTISGTPSTLFQADPFLFGDILGATVDDEKLVTIQFNVDAAGNFVSGITGADLIVKGSIDTNFDGILDYDGTLLQAEVTQFGFQDGGLTDDFYDLRATQVSGLLAGLYAGRDLAVRVTSEISTEYPNAFADSFATDFTSQAKGVVGATDALTPPSCSLDVEAYCSVAGSPNASKCRIKVTRSPKHWEREDYSHNGKTHSHSTLGMHGDPVPAWATKYGATPVLFSYVITNTGTTPVSGLTLVDSLDSALSGVPATLAPGASATVTRTISLSEEVDNVVTVLGSYSTATCGDTDVVIVRDKLRDRRRHDYDQFNDKGEDDEKNRR